METALLSSGSQEPGQFEPVESTFDAAAPVEERIRALEQAVRQEQQARQILEDEIFILREEVEQREAERAGTEERINTAIEERREAFMARRFGGSPMRGEVDRLVEGGFAPDQAEWIVRREAELQMERLQARYDAMRDSDEQSWFGRGLSDDSALRAELGEADYERYLAATGRSTSAGIGAVIPNSPAHNAGFQPGDQIVRYDGERIYSMMDMTSHIMRSEAEGNVVVDIERNGMAMQLVIPRGPLGVTGN